MNWFVNHWTRFAVLALVGVVPASAQEWTRFHGPNGTGESETTTIPAAWTDKDYNWRVKLPGVGHSSPVLWGHRLFVMSGEPKEGTRYLLCFDATKGEKLWEKDFESTPYRVHAQNSLASSSPTVDAERVYVTWAAPSNVNLMALTHAGEIVWKLDLGPWSSQNGYGASPVVIDGKVILSVSQENPQEPKAAQQNPNVVIPESFVLAVDPQTGKEIWRTKREPRTASYASPALFHPKQGPDQLVVMSTGDGMYALDLKTGKELWSNVFFSKRTVSSPVIKGEMIFGSTGSGGGGNYFVAARSDGAQPTLAYKIETQAPYVPTSVARGDLVFLCGDAGIVSCLDLNSGEVHWRKRIGGNYSSSPVRAHDKIYCTSMDGEVVVLAADKEFQELGRTSLGEGCRSTPAVANGCMYLRTFSELMSIGGDKRQASNR